jgi:hypothetical protein
MLEPLRKVVGLQAETGYSIGTLVDFPRDWLSGSGFTAVLFLRHSCGACQAAVPQFRRIVDRAGAKNVSVIAVTLRSDRRLDEDQDRSFARELGLTDSQIHVSDAGTLRLRRVPTMLLVTSDGRIVYHAAGAITSSDIDRLLGASRALPD